MASPPLAIPYSSVCPPPRRLRCKKSQDNVKMRKCENANGKARQLVGLELGLGIVLLLPF